MFFICNQVVIIKTKDPKNVTFNIHRLASNIPKQFIGTIEERNFPINWPEAIEELKFIVSLVPKYFKYIRGLNRYVTPISKHSLLEFLLNKEVSMNSI